jgi:hypothetical protein
MLITGTPEQIIEMFRGRPAQHDEHCIGWRWKTYMRDIHKRDDAMREAARQIIKRRNDQREALQEIFRQAAAE